MEYRRPLNCGCGEPGTDKRAREMVVRCHCGRRWVSLEVLNDRKKFVEELLAKYPGDDPPLIDQAMMAIEDIVNVTQAGEMTRERAVGNIQKVLAALNAGAPPPMGYLLEN